jgi:hypothetical protein
MRALYEIAQEITTDWKVINNGAAREALKAMKTMGAITDRFGADPNGYSVVGTFLTHCKGWQGPVAHRLKRELRQMSGHPRP